MILKTITQVLTSIVEGTIGKLLIDSSVCLSGNAATVSRPMVSAKAQQLIRSLVAFSTGLNKKGTFADELITDTLVFISVKASVL